MEIYCARFGSTYTDGNLPIRSFEINIYLLVNALGLIFPLSIEHRLKQGLELRGQLFKVTHYSDTHSSSLTNVYNSTQAIYDGYASFFQC